MYPGVVGLRTGHPFTHFTMSYSLRGTVTNALGRPLHDASVIIRTSPEPLPDLAQLTDRRGQFDWGGLPAGRYTLSVTYADHTVQLPCRLPLSDPLTIVLP